MGFVFNNFPTSSQLIPNNLFVFIYFLASFRKPTCVFNNIMASIVYFFVYLQIPVCAKAHWFPPLSRCVAARTLPSTICPHHNHNYRLSLRPQLVKRKVQTNPPGGISQTPGDGWRRPPKFGVCDLPKGRVRRNCFEVRHCYAVRLYANLSSHLQSGQTGADPRGWRIRADAGWRRPPTFGVCDLPKGSPAGTRPNELPSGSVTSQFRLGFGGGWRIRADVNCWHASGTRQNSGEFPSGLAVVRLEVLLSRRRIRSAYGPRSETCPFGTSQTSQGRGLRQPPSDGWRRPPKFGVCDLPKGSPEGTRPKELLSFEVPRCYAVRLYANLSSHLQSG